MSNPEQIDQVEAAPAEEARQEDHQDVLTLASFTDPAREKFMRAARAWVNELINNSPVSRSTEAIGHLNKVLPRLYDYVQKEQ